MKVNGLTIPLAFVIPALLFTFWLGGISVIVVAQGDDQIKHEAAPAHAEAALATNTVQADVRHNKEKIADINKKLDDIEEQMAEDKDEILEAIRSQ